MAQLCTAQFIDDNWPVTGLTPTVTISEVMTWTVNWTFNMEEVTPWNYRYNYINWSDAILYYFNYDAWAEYH